MKKCFIFYLLLLLGVVNSIFAQTKLSPREFLFIGKVNGQDSGFVYLDYLESKNVYKKDSCRLVNGAFKFKGTVEEPTHVDFWGNIKSQSVEDSNFTEFFISDTIIHGNFKANDFKHAKIIGCYTQDEYYGLNFNASKISMKWQPMTNEIAEAKTKNESAKLDSIYAYQYPIYTREIKKLWANFIQEHPNSYVSAYLLNGYFGYNLLSLDSIEYFYSRLSKKIQGSINGQFVNEYIEGKKRTAIGVKAPDFSMPDSTGKNVPLSDFKGKYVLLDFWASWCIPCREESSYLTKTYNDYKDKDFTIISFSLDGREGIEKAKKNWLAAIKKDGYVWPQLCDFKAMDSPMISKYSIYNGIPANFLINPDGIIIAKDLRGDDLEKTIATFIK